MNARLITTIAHTAALLAIVAVSLLALMAQPIAGNWAVILILSKAIAVGGFAAAFKLYKYWLQSDAGLRWYHKMCTGEEAPR
jgi:hypothetical protein